MSTDSSTDHYKVEGACLRRRCLRFILFTTRMVYGEQSVRKVPQRVTSIRTRPGCHVCGRSSGRPGAGACASTNTAVSLVRK